MMLSTRSRYGLQMMIELALRDSYGRPVLLKEISETHNISEKYLSKLVIALKNRGLVVSERGAKGGYNLARKAKDINIYDIIDALEGDITFSETPNGNESGIRSGLAARELWKELDNVLKSFLTSKTLEEMAGVEGDQRSTQMYYI